MENEMEVDTLESRGTKRPAEENETPKPKKIRVSYARLSNSIHRLIISGT